MGCRSKSAVLAVMLSIVALAASSAQAASYEKLYGLLKDVKGWEAKKPEGMRMDMPGMKMIQATREYSNGKGNLNAMIMMGGAGSIGAYTQQTKMNYEDEDTKMSFKEIDGFKCHLLYDKKENSGVVTVIVKPDEEEPGIFVLSYEGVSDGDALKIAREFDWKKIADKLKNFE
ncbi:hypothetical protein DRQ05_03145 [bacterium]|nr:MAG: hypothetical protein DRQ05_03145 [bacterium]